MISWLLSLHMRLRVLFSNYWQFCASIDFYQSAIYTHLVLNRLPACLFLHCFEFCVRLRSFVFFPCNQNEFDFRSSLFAANSYCWFEIGVSDLDGTWKIGPAIRSSRSASIRMQVHFMHYWHSIVLDTGLDWSVWWEQCEWVCACRANDTI